MWDPVEGASQYQLYQNGILAQTTFDKDFVVPDSKQLEQYQCRGIERFGSSFFF